MKIRSSFNLGIFAGLIVLTAGIFLFSSVLIKKINEKDYLGKKITEINHPSVVYLNDLAQIYSQSKNLILSCCISNTLNDSLFREKYKKLFISEISLALNKLTGLSLHWEPDDRQIFETTSLLIRDSLFYAYQDLLSRIRQDKMAFPDLIGADKFLEQIKLIPLFKKIDDEINLLLFKQQQEIILNHDIISENSSEIRRMIRIFLLAVILLFFIFFLVIEIYVNKSFKKLAGLLEMLSKGTIPPKIITERHDQTGKTSVILNKLIDYYNRLSLILKKILNKELDTDFVPDGPDDEPGNIIYGILQSMKLSNEEQQRNKKEEFERIWTAEGIVMINEIIGKSWDEPGDLGYRLIRKIAEYTVSRAGAIFLVDKPGEGESFMEMLASYGLARPKNQEKKLAAGEGLIGRCVIENKTLYITDIPDDYLKIKSGMGESDPVSLLIVPLHLNDNVFGVIELASFSLFDTYKIKFVEIIEGSIASALSKLQINIQTSQLLEQTKAQAEQLAVQKNEMERNLEELRRTIVLLAEKEERLKKEIEILRHQSEK